VPQLDLCGVQKISYLVPANNESKTSGYMMTSIEQLRAICLTDANFSELPDFQEGKVRDSYDLPDGRRIMITTDRQSAFDRVLAAVPFKGQVLNQTARFWFDRTADT